MGTKTKYSIQVECNNVLSQAENVHGCFNVLQNAFIQISECIGDMDTASGWQSTGEGARACYKQLTYLLREITNLQKRVLAVYRTTKTAANSYKRSEFNALKLAQQREHQAGS